MKIKINDIKAEFESADIHIRKQLVEQYRHDERIGVVKLVERYQKEQKKIEEELVRLEKMSLYENKYREYAYICGIDEAGRGPLAGPVVAGAVILKKGEKILYIHDSKQVRAGRRELLFDEIMEKAVSVGVGIVSADIIDRINILQATYEAMRIAVSKLSIQPEILLNDAVTIPNLPFKQEGIIKGDGKSITIAAASIIAKVTRDRLMAEYDKLYPEYHFASNKGYGSKEHIEALKAKGPCPIHRTTFITNFVE